MANKVKAKKGTIASKTFAVEGTTLQEIWESLRKRARKSSDAVAEAETPISVPAFKSSDFEEEDDDYVPGMKDGEVGISVSVKSGEITMTGTITLPELKSDKDLSDKAKKEWARFLKVVSKHEDEHIDAGFEVAKEIADEISNLTGRGKGKDKKAARKAAEADFVKQFNKAYTGAEPGKRIKKAHDDFDAKGNTFDLDTSIT